MGILGHWVAGTPSASAKRSVAEQKMAIGWQGPLVQKKVSGTKNGGTKIGGTKIWWGSSAIGWQGPLVQVQKGQWNKKWWDKNSKGLKLCRTKKNWWGLLDIGSSASAKRSAEQKCRTKTAEQKLVGTIGQGPLVQVQKGQWNKKQWNKNSGIKIGGDPLDIGWGLKYKCKKVSKN